MATPKLLRVISLGLLMIFCLVAVSAQASQECETCRTSASAAPLAIRQSEVLELQYTHNVQINGEESVANVTGSVDLSTGIVTVDGRIDRYIDGYFRWPVSWLTLIMTSVLPAVSLEQDGAVNLLTATDGELGYEVVALTQNDYADITTRISVRRDGDTIIAELNSEGESRYPEIVGMGDRPMVIRQTPTEDGFRESGVKQLVSADGEVIEIAHDATFTGVSIPDEQTRTVTLEVLEEAEDSLSVSLQYGGRVFPFDPGILTLEACERGGFSTEEDFMALENIPADGNPYISDGDLLSFSGEVCARNQQLVQNFDVIYDMGLDALDILSIEERIIAFSTELDSPHGNFSAGDLLFPDGTRIPNSALVLRFQIPYDIGLDGVHFVGNMDRIPEFLERIRSLPPTDLGGGQLQELLQAFDLDIWFSIEGTWDFAADVQILDGDVLSARDGIVVLRQDQLLDEPIPAGIPKRGVDFGLDGLTGPRDVDRSAMLFSTEILFDDEPPFTDGDVLKIGGSVAIDNSTVVTPFTPAADFLGLDAISLNYTEPPRDPQIQDICGTEHSVGDFEGGPAPVGSSNPAFTGLYQVPADINENGLIEAGEYNPSPCGLYVPIGGRMPPDAATRFRVVFREHTEPVPASVGASTTRNIQTLWSLKSWDPILATCKYQGLTLSTDTDGWMDVIDYWEAKTGLDFDGDSLTYTDGCENDGLVLAVWNTFGLPAPERDGHHVIWLEWDGASGLEREPVEYHVQLDNTRPQLTGLEVRLMDGSTVVETCGEAPEGVSEFQVFGEFKDAYHGQFSISIKGGTPPPLNYGPHPHYSADDGSGFSNTDNGGTIGTGLQHLRNINMADMGDRFTKCCYILELYVSDRAILHTFNNRQANPTNSWTSAPFYPLYVTFAAAP
jgi:hypothetical protein